MAGLRDVSGGVARGLARLAFAIGGLIFWTQCAVAATCPVIHRGPPTAAGQALLAADYAKAEDLYRAGLASSPGNADLVQGLVHALLRDQKAQEAADAVKTALAAAPNSPALITLRGEVEFRQGDPWAAGQSLNQSYKLDPCNPRTYLLAADLSRISSEYASARRNLLVAHQLDPGDPEIRSEWMMTLPRQQRIAEIEAYLTQPNGEDADGLRRLREYLDRLKKEESEPPKACRLVSQSAATKIPFAYLMEDATHVEAFGLEVKLNGHAARLEIDTGAGGLLVTNSVAKRAGLKAFSQAEVGGIGDEGDKGGYTAYADSIRIGDLEFQNCAVRVVNGRNLLGDLDGLIGMDVFSRFLVTLDYPMRKLILGPLPARPGEEAAPVPKLNMGGDDEEASEAGSKEQAGATASSSKMPLTSTAHGPYDRFIAPEMKDYTKVFRVGQYLLIPASVNSSKPKLFILDTGASTTIISPQAAREVTKVYGDSFVQVQGVNGMVKNVYLADDLTFRFANLRQKGKDVISIDTSKISKEAGMEISGFLGATTLGQLTVHIDYRDGLVKFDYDPKRGYQFRQPSE